MSLRAPRAWRFAFGGSNRRLMRMLVLALLLPLAQAIAAAHLTSHHNPLAQRDSAPASQLDAPCALCMLAVPLAGGALPCTHAPVIAMAGTLATPAAPAASVHTSALALAYRSRAPPAPLL